MNLRCFFEVPVTYRVTCLEFSLIPEAIKPTIISGFFRIMVVDTEEGSRRRQRGHASDGRVVQVLPLRMVDSDTSGTTSFGRTFRKFIDTTADFCSERFFQMLYFGTFYSGWAFVFRIVYPMAKASDNVGSYHQTIGIVLFVVSFLSWWLAVTTSPGSITKQSLTRFDNYPYDNVLYFNKTCPTLRIRKLPRSKYDRNTNTHVPRFDHFCPLLVQPVGEENYRFFLAFIAVHTGMCWYGGAILCRLLWGIVLQDSTYGALFKANLSVVTVVRRFVAILFLNLFVGYIMIFLFGVSVILSLFLEFHIYLIARGMTTNEYYKWKDVAMQHKSRKSEEARIRRLEKNARLRIPSNLGDEESPLDGKVRLDSNMPINSYNLGLIRNVHEVMFPRSVRSKKRRD